MRAKGIFLTLCLLLVTYAFLASGMEHDKFQKCNDKAFCKRLREQKKTNYRVDVIDPNEAQGILRGTLIDPDQPTNSLSFSVQAYEKGIFRFKVEDFVRKRYQVQDVIVDSAKTAPFKFTKDADSVTLTTAAGNSKLVISLPKFEVKLFTADNTLVISMNADDLFRQEQIKQEGVETEDDGALAADFTFHGAQHVFGIPERATSLSLKPTRNENGEIQSEPYRIYNLDIFEYELDNPIGLYGIVPLLMSITDSGVSGGVFWLNPSESFVDVQRKDGGVGSGAHWISESGLIDVFFLPGPTVKHITMQYAYLTGTPFMPQYFSIAYHQCRWNYKDEADVRDVDAKFDEHDIPYDVLWLDIEHTDSKMYFTWNKELFPNPKQMIDDIATKGRKMVTISDPHIKRQSGYYVHEEATSKGYYIKKSDGTTDFDGWCWPGSSSWLDFFNADVRSWYASLYAFDKYIGSTENLYTWIDMNEPSVFSGPEVTMPKDAVHLDGTLHRDVHNMYGFYQGMATYEGHIRRRNGLDRPFILSRSFFAGSQRYVAVWTGDNTAKWDHLEKSLPMILSLSISGIPFIGADVGAFFLNPETELLVRWYQMGAFYPFFRAHAHLETKRREPWLFGDEPMRNIRSAVIRRYTMLPYWYTLWFETHVTGVPVVRPMFFEYPSDAATHGMDDQYLVGTDILVKPVTQAGATSVTLYLPAKSGQWFDFDTGAKYESTDSGTNVELAAPIEHLPVLQRGGSILPKKERVRRSSAQTTHDPYTLVVALNHEGYAEGQLYIDDGKTFNYRNGDFLLRQFTFAHSGKPNSNQYVLRNAAANTTEFTLTTSSPTSPTFTVTPRKPASGKSGSGFRAINAVEKVVVYGLPIKPSRVWTSAAANNNEAETIVASGAEDPVVVHGVDFEYDATLQRLVLRKPDLLIAEEWSLFIE